MGNTFNKYTYVYQENKLLKSKIEELIIQNNNLLKILNNDKHNIAILKKEIKESFEESNKKQIE